MARAEGIPVEMVIVNDDVSLKGTRLASGARGLAGTVFIHKLVVGGLLSHEEIATRGSISLYVYSPPGENERLIERAGFRQIRVTDTTESAARVAKHWHHAREKGKRNWSQRKAISTSRGCNGSYPVCIP